MNHLGDCNELFIFIFFNLQSCLHQKFEEVQASFSCKNNNSKEVKTHCQREYFRDLSKNCKKIGFFDDNCLPYLVTLCIRVSWNRT